MIRLLNDLEGGIIMDEVAAQFEKIFESWKRIYETADAAPSSWQPHLPNTSLIMINELVETVNYWLSRVRAPAGFSPGFQLAKSTAASSLPSLLASAKQLEAAQYNHFPTFINGLMNLLSSLHTMSVFSQKNDRDAVVSDFTAQLSQGLALLGTAQKELADKANQLNDTTNLADVISEKHDQIIKLEETAKLETELITTHSNDSKIALDGITALLLKAKSSDEEFGTLLAANKKLQGNLDEMAVEIQSLQKESQAQSEIIDSILPKAASAGLAAAFAMRGKQLNLTKWIWMVVFIAALIGLSAFAYYLTTIEAAPGEFWQQILYKIPLAAPLIWLGWFSAIQYGGIIRVQEDYAFKEATSKAFQGYRDHLEHLASVNLPEAGTAMNLLAAKTIEILAHEPLRIYGKTEKDASPAHSLVEIFSGARKNVEGQQ